MPVISNIAHQKTAEKWKRDLGVKLVKVFIKDSKKVEKVKCSIYLQGVYDQDTFNWWTLRLSEASLYRGEVSKVFQYFTSRPNKEKKAFNKFSYSKKVFLWVCVLVILYFSKKVAKLFWTANSDVAL